MREHEVNPEMKSLVSSREWKWDLLHGGSLSAQSGNWAASLVVSALETGFLQAHSNRPNLLSANSTWFRVGFAFLGSIIQVLGYRLCSLEAGTCETLVLLLILERSDGSSGEKQDGHSQP